MKLPKLHEIAPNTTKIDLASKLYPDITFDCALPQSFVDDYAAHGVDVRGVVVWGYPESNIFGVPLPLTKEIESILEHTL